jgi:phosphoglycolate phosphatase
MADLPASMRGPLAVVLDWDNTLVDTWEVIREALNRTLTRYGLDSWTAEQAKARVRRSMRESFPVLFGTAWQEAGDHFIAAYADLHLERLQALPGAEEALRTLAAARIPAAVVSNKTGPLLREEARHLGWEGLLRAIIGAGDTSRDKPAAEPVAAALGSCGVDPGPHVWLIGDTDVDLECAASSGCTGVLLRPEPPLAGEFAGFPPALHIPDCDALSNLIRKL